MTETFTPPVIGRLVIIGEAPGDGAGAITHRPELALTGSSGRNLAKIAGWEWLEYLRRTDRRNLFYEPEVAMGGRWPARLARVRSAELEAQLRGRTVILLGAKVAEAFGAASDPLYRWLHLDWAEVARVPHPSGLNRVWNDPAERARARDFLGGLLR